MLLLLIESVSGCILIERIKSAGMCFWLPAYRFPINTLQCSNDCEDVFHTCLNFEHLKWMRITISMHKTAIKWRIYARESSKTECALVYLFWCCRVWCRAEVKRRRTVWILNRNVSTNVTNTCVFANICKQMNHMCSSCRTPRSCRRTKSQQQQQKKKIE